MEQRPAPTNLRSLETRISNVARDRAVPVRRIQRAVANTVIGQMLPGGVVKGGTAVKLRLGERASRFTPDFDVGRDDATTAEGYLEALRERLAAGWGGFTGIAAERDPASPIGVPVAYLMRPYDIALRYRDRHWLTVLFELGAEEIDTGAAREQRVAPDLVELFATLGLERPAPVALLAASVQVAQKLHACTFLDPRTGQNDRAHDLVDLQLLAADTPLDTAEIGRVAPRLFAFRRAQPWPPTVVAHERWDELYREAARDLDVLPQVADAVAWANDLIARADAAG